MPTYEYRCDACGHTFEQFQSIKAEPVKRCPKCSKNKVRRLISSGAGLIFKGSGFYITDYRDKSYTDKAKAESGGGETKGGEAKSGDAKPAESTGGESKPAEKRPEPKPAETKPSEPTTASKSASKSGKRKK